MANELDIPEDTFKALHDFATTECHEFLLIDLITKDTTMKYRKSFNERKKMQANLPVVSITDTLQCAQTSQAVASPHLSSAFGERTDGWYHVGVQSSHRFVSHCPRWCYPLDCWTNKRNPCDSWIRVAWGSAEDSIAPSSCSFSQVQSGWESGEIGATRHRNNDATYLQRCARQ